MSDRGNIKFFRKLSTVKRKKNRPTISDVLRHHLRHADLSVTAICEAAGTSQPNVTNWLKDESLSLNLRTVEKLCAVLGLVLVMQTDLESHAGES